MRHTVVMLLLLTIQSCGQRDSTDQQDQKRLEIERLLTAEKMKLVVLVRVSGQAELQRVIDENWPENIETTYNILKNRNGRIVYVGEFPTSESGDWTLVLKHYFSDDGTLIAFEKGSSYFNDSCGDGIVVEKQIELYDNQFKLIRMTKTLTDKGGNSLTERDCANGIDWDIVKRPTVQELLDLKEIRL